MVEPAHKFLNFLKTIPAVGTMDYLNSVMGKRGVKVIYEKGSGYTEDGPVYERITLGTFKRSCDFEFPGVIFTPVAGGGYKVLSVPSAPPMSQYRKNDIERNFRGSSIIKAEDGTTVTLYYYERLSKWVISTYRGFDVNSYELVGSRTYEDVVREVMDRYPMFSFDNLDKSMCYTIGFNHPDIHPFIPKAEPNNVSPRAWFIRAVNTEKFGNGGNDYIDYGLDIGIPLQQYVKFSTMREMYNTANKAYSSYVEDGIANYGYIVRIGYRSYLVESTLLSEIRKLFYSNRFADISARYNKKNYAIISGVLSREKYDTMVVLFPQYEAIYNVMDTVTTALISGVMKLVYPLNTEGGVTKCVDMDTVAKAMHKGISETVTLEKYEVGEAHSLIRSYLYDPRFTEVFYKLVFFDANQIE